MPDASNQPLRPILRGLEVGSEVFLASPIPKNPRMFEQTFKNIDDILHKDAGCTSELDYTEQSSWLLFAPAGLSSKRSGLRVSQQYQLQKPRGSAVQLREVQCNLNCHQVCPDSGVHFISIPKRGKHALIVG